MDISRARMFIYQNARPLDLARWQFLFENGSRESVLKALAVYQNADGGFGHGLEADCWNPESSPIQTWAATEILREVRMNEKTHPIVQGILHYFETLLQVQIAHILKKDTSVWATEYVCKPSLFIHSRNSRFYAANKDLCDFECSFLSETQKPDGSWDVTWDWGQDPEQWHISKNWWKADLILKNRKFYQSMMG